MAVTVYNASGQVIAASKDSKKQVGDVDPSKKIDTSDRKSSSSGSNYDNAVIQGKVYDNVTEQEVLNNRLNENTQAVPDTQSTADRDAKIKTSSKIEQGKTLTSADLYNLAKKVGSSGVDITKTQGTADAVQNYNFSLPEKRSGTQILTQQQTDFYKQLPKNEKKNYLEQLSQRDPRAEVINRLQQEAQKQGVPYSRNVAEAQAEAIFRGKQQSQTSVITPTGKSTERRFFDENGYIDITGYSNTREKARSITSSENLSNSIVKPYEVGGYIFKSPLSKKEEFVLSGAQSYDSAITSGFKIIGVDSPGNKTKLFAGSVVGGISGGLTLAASPFLVTKAAPLIGGALITQAASVKASENVYFKGYKDTFKDDTFKQAFFNARIATEKEIGQQNFVSGVLASGVPLVTRGFFKDTFTKNFELEVMSLKAPLADKKRYLDAGLPYLTTREAGELSAALFIGAGTERAGRAAITKGLQKFSYGSSSNIEQNIISKASKQAYKDILAKKPLDTTLKTISKAATPNRITRTASKFEKTGFFVKKIAPLGAIEGASESITSDLAREGKINPTRAVFGATIGTVTAGTLGGLYGASKGFKQKSYGFLGNVLDVTEKPGDIVADISENVIKAPRRAVDAIAETSPFRAASVLSTDLAPAPKARVFTAVPALSSTPETSVSNNFVPVSVQTSNAVTSSNPFPLFKSKFSPLFVNKGNFAAATPNSQTFSTAANIPFNVYTNTPADVPANIPLNVAAPSAASVPVSVSVSVPTDVTVSVPVSVPTSVSVPVSTPVIKGNFGLGLGNRMQRGYNAYVREKGKYVKVNKQPLTKEQAEARGAYVTDNSSAAQFKVSRTNKLVDTMLATGSYNKEKFRKNQKSNSFIEKTTNRIDTPGERRGITAKGLLKQEAKRSFSSAFSGGVLPKNLFSTKKKKGRSFKWGL